MKVKELLEKVDGVCLIAIKKEIKYGNSYALVPNPPEEIMNKTVKNITPFYSRDGVHKYGIIVSIEENKTK